MIKKQVDTKKMELDMNQQKLNEKQTEYTNCDIALEPIEKERQSILEIHQNLAKVVAERTKVETE